MTAAPRTANGTADRQAAQRLTVDSAKNAAAKPLPQQMDAEQDLGGANLSPGFRCAAQRFCRRWPRYTCTRLETANLADAGVGVQGLVQGTDEAAEWQRRPDSGGVPNGPRLQWGDGRVHSAVSWQFTSWETGRSCLHDGVPEVRPSQGHLLSCQYDIRPQSPIFNI